MDGMAEVTNCIMEQLLRIHTTTDGWVATPQSRMGRMPHKVAHEGKLRMPMDVVTTLMTVPAVEEYITRMQCIWESVR